MRHANAEVDLRKYDLQRGLTKEGLAEAEQAALFLSNYQIDKIIVSSANRTMETAGIIQQKIIVNDLEKVTELYKGGVNDVLKLLVSHSSENKYILIIGHNPLIYTIALGFIDCDTEIYDELIQSAMPTAGIIVMDFPAINDWCDITGQKGVVIEIFTPLLA
jgi:phosphohistidine phosphatase